jgi:hypothetical protein
MGVQANDPDVGLEVQSANGETKLEASACPILRIDRGLSCQLDVFVAATSRGPATAG